MAERITHIKPCGNTRITLCGLKLVQTKHCLTEVDFHAFYTWNEPEYDAVRWCVHCRKEAEKAEA